VKKSSTFVAANGDGYELNMGRWSRRLAASFLDFVGTAPGERVLDAGCGTGALAAEVLTRSQPLEVHAVDLVEVYVEYARERNFDSRCFFAVGDACALSYPSNYFDRVLSLLALHFMPKPMDAITEMRRVARPGATVSAAVWDARGGFVANRLFFDTAAALDPRASVRRARNYTRPLTKPGELAAAWRDAGLVDVVDAQISIRMDFAHFHDYWSPYLGKDGPGAEYVGSLEPDERARLEAAVRDAYLDGEPDGPRSYAALAWAVKGIVPGSRGHAA
jgi:SAM-dependent methyltransferase